MAASERPYSRQNKRGQQTFANFRTLLSSGYRSRSPLGEWGPLSMKQDTDKA